MRSPSFGSASSGATTLTPGASPFFWWNQREVGNYSALLSGRTWIGSDGDSVRTKPTFITYSFQSRMTEADADAFPGSRSHWHSFSRKDKADARAALKKWGAASGITFLEAKGDHGDIQFSWAPQEDSSGLGYFPASDDLGDITYDNFYVESYDEIAGNIYLNTHDRSRFAADPAWKKYVLLHEIGHALGLKHPFSSTFYNGRMLSEKYDSVSNTVMAYLKEGEKPPTSLKKFDIQAIRKLYGSHKMDGKQVAQWSWNAKTEVLTQIGKTTDDVLWGTKVTDKLYGDYGNDRLHGMAGDDLLSGGPGSDILIGGPGRDSFRFDHDPAADRSIDTILDFNADFDRIDLWTGAFRDLGPAGVLLSTKFAEGSAAKDLLVRILFDTDTDQIIYDSDGSGPAPSIVVAQLKLKAAETMVNAGHFWVV